MTHLQFQQALEGLTVPDCVVDYKYNAKRKRFEIIVTAQINGLYHNCGVYFPDEWLNDTKKCNDVLDNFAERMYNSVQKAKSDAKKFN